jgi:hypothetical protein
MSQALTAIDGAAGLERARYLLEAPAGLSASVRRIMACAHAASDPAAGQDAFTELTMALMDGLEEGLGARTLDGLFAYARTYPGRLPSLFYDAVDLAVNGAPCWLFDPHCRRRCSGGAHLVAFPVLLACHSARRPAVAMTETDRDWIRMGVFGPGYRLQHLPGLYTARQIFDWHGVERFRLTRTLMDAARYVAACSGLSTPERFAPEPASELIGVTLEGVRLQLGFALAVVYGPAASGAIRLDAPGAREHGAQALAGFVNAVDYGWTGAFQAPWRYIDPPRTLNRVIVAGQRRLAQVRLALAVRVVARRHGPLTARVRAKARERIEHAWRVPIDLFKHGRFVARVPYEAPLLDPETQLHQAIGDALRLAGTDLCCGP